MIACPASRRLTGLHAHVAWAARSARLADVHMPAAVAACRRLAFTADAGRGTRDTYTTRLYY